MPAAQPTQSLSDPDQPALQKQSAKAIAPARENAPAPQAEHAPAPGVAAYLLVTQTRHCPVAEMGLYVPGTHCRQLLSTPPQPSIQKHCITQGLRACEVVFSRHAVQFDVSGAEYVPAGHSEHMSDAAPTTPENVPAAHLSQSDAPALNWYFPATHSRHCVVPPTA